METKLRSDSIVRARNAFSNLFPARGWKRSSSVPAFVLEIALSQTFSPQGDGNTRALEHEDKTSSTRLSQTFSPQGDGNPRRSMTEIVLSTFSNLFPARGWKLGNRHGIQLDVIAFLKPFPRKGMETSAPSFSFIDIFSFSNLFPARGWKRLLRATRSFSLIYFLKPFPRKGMETFFFLNLGE